MTKAEIIKRLSQDRRRQQIIEAAMPLIAMNGIAATTTKTIAAAAGISEALLYKHFENKEQILSEIHNLCACETTDVGNELAGMKPGVETLILATYFMFSIIYRPLPGMESREKLIKRLMLQSLLSNGEFAHEFLSSKFFQFIKPLQDCILAAHKAGHIEGSVTAANARIRVLLTHHVPVIMSIFNLPDQKVLDYGSDKDQVFDEAVRFTLRGLGLKEASIKKYYQPKNHEKWLLQAFANVQQQGATQ